MGISFLLIGISGLVLAGLNFVNGAGSLQNISTVIIYSICGMIFFISGYEYLEASRHERRKISKVDEA